MKSVLFCLICGLLYFIPVAADESLLDPSDGCDDDMDMEIKDVALEMVDDVHSAVSSRIIKLSDKIDNFFVADRMEDEGSNTRILYSFFVTEDIHGNFTRDYLFKARLSLPKTQDRLRLVVESTVNPNRDNENNLVAGSINEERNSDFSTALQFIFTKTKSWQVSNKTGVRFAVPPDPFTQLRIRRLFSYELWVTRLTETLFVSQSQAFGQSTSLAVERPVTKGVFFRSRSELTTAQKGEGAKYIQQLSFYRPKNERMMWVYSFGAEADIGDKSEISRYYLNVRFRHNFYKKWAFYEMVPELSFDRVNDFKMLPIMLFKIDVVFGKI